ncbi:MAG: RNA polymerase sigma factor [Dermatophilaceae bacterium]
MSVEKTPPELTDETRFSAVYTAWYPDVLRFVTRRVHPTHAEDVVAEVFLVLWRRLNDLPADDDAGRAWTFGIARQVLLNDRRGDRRRKALAVRIATEEGSPTTSIDVELVARRMDLAAAWPRLTEMDQEVLSLAYWDDLTSTGAALVLGISPVAFRLRLSRARRNLRRHLHLVDTIANRPALLPEVSSS